MYRRLFFSIAIILTLTSQVESRDSITVYIFLLDECRISQEMTPELNSLYNEFGINFGFIGIFPNFSSKKKAIEDFKSKYKIQFPTKTDYFKKLSNTFNATVLPEVIVLNETRNKIIYRGAINDLYYTQGKRRQIIRNQYLRDALFGLVNGVELKVKETQPIGCFINFNDPLNTFFDESK